MSVDFDRVNKACMDAFAQNTGKPGAVEAYTSAVHGLLDPTPRGDFRNQATTIEDEAEVEIRTRVPMLGVRLSEFPAFAGDPAGALVEPEQDDTVTIDGVLYVVVDVDDNGAGHAWLRLQKKV